MEGGEIEKLLKVWVWVFISLFYSYLIPKSIPKGPKRLVSILPVVALFLYLPLNLSSVHLAGLTSFFIAWLANFKLLLFSFGRGPLCNPPPSSLPLFVAVSCLPIKIQIQQPPPTAASSSRALNYTLKALCLAVLIRVYDYRDRIHPKLLLILYVFHIYFMLEIILAASAASARALLGLELEPQFNEPYLSTSLQDFWGRRWNLTVTRILRPSVYDPTRDLFTRFVGPKSAPLPAVFATFVVSALMHELMFYYMGRARPTWETTCFFLLHGAAVTSEIAVKKAVNDKDKEGRWSSWWVVSASRVLTMGFVTTTACWLFFPKFVHCQLDAKAFEEYAAVGAFLTNVSNRISYEKFYNAI
ncbi:unnamed protein product [Linum trigynum]|uniref:Wax synthase domain-containing protein n=1 Tax=Linum trigynum TaxID=586398 RepID=A0AAV2GMP1_9ROSI